MSILPFFSKSSQKDSSGWQCLKRHQRHWIKYVVFAALILVLLHWQWTTFSPKHTHLRLQHQFSAKVEERLAQDQRLDAVKAEFLHAWSGYKNNSWMSDSLKPISGGSDNRYCGWSATLVDSLDTLYIMGLHEEFDDAVDAVVDIDFEGSTQDCQVNFFETTIRYLGGMLAAYDLSMDERLKPKVIEIAEILYLAFNTTTGMPCSHCNLSKARPRDLPIPDHDAPLADTFSFSLEFLRVWQITGNKKYLDKVLSISAIFFEAQNKSSLPGLWPEGLDASSIDGPDAKFVSSSTTYGLGALSDSAYEYLVKAHLLLGDPDNDFAGMWQAASGKIKRHLLFRAYIPDSNGSDTMFAGIAKKPGADAPLSLEPRIEHLTCFAGGMFALASRVMNEPDDMDIGSALTRGCVWAYNTGPVGIMPETVTLLKCPDPQNVQCVWNEEIWQYVPDKSPNYPAGYISSIDTHYGLRPEAVESLFVLYRLTGQEKWRDMGWNMFNKIIQQTRARYGHAALTNVIDVDQRNGTPVAKQKDEMESFWLAETLKYFYLLFSDPHLINLDEFVLNTEAHPLRLTAGAREKF